MAYDPITEGIGLARDLAARIWPDPAMQANAMFKLEELAQKGDLAGLNAETKLMIAQLSVNKAEAESGNVFTSGWRPFIGWVGGVAMAYQFVIYPLLIWCTSGIEGFTPPPVLDTGALFSIVTAMLGLGGMRSYDKLKGTHTAKVGK